MELYSTNHQSQNVSLKEAVLKGLPSDNGLYMPTNIPAFDSSFFKDIHNLSFQEIAFQVGHKLMGDEVPEDKLNEIINDAVNFEAPIKELQDNLYVLELFHGPTLAFKDFGARFMSRLMAFFLHRQQKEINILVATSGDTGSAVAQGFLNVPGISVTILYPKGKVSEIQEKQLTTNGHNIDALEIDGTFDDCQRLVKTAFLDSELNEKLNLTSANSINISRLIPQSFYYFNAYAQLKNEGNPVVFCTPSGNLGNLCGGLLAYKMGLPVHKFVAATNSNNVVANYLNKGVFEPTTSVKTLSNAMDVGNPSNYPRMIDLFDNDYNSIKETIVGKSYTDHQTEEAIKEVYDKTGYILCPHSAIGYLGLRDTMLEIGQKNKGIFLSTAHPCKFPEVVEPLIKSKIEIPERLKTIVNREKKATSISKEFADFKTYLLRDN